MTQPNTSAGLLADEHNVYRLQLGGQRLCEALRKIADGCDSPETVAKAALDHKAPDPDFTALRTSQSAAPASEADCPRCRGDGGVMGPQDGYSGPTDRYRKCSDCNGTGKPLSRPSESAETVELLREAREQLNDTSAITGNLEWRAALGNLVDRIDATLAKLDAQGGAGDAE